MKANEINKPDKVTYYIVMIKGDYLTHGECGVENVTTTIHDLETFTDLEKFKEALVIHDVEYIEL